MKSILRFSLIAAFASICLLTDYASAAAASLQASSTSAKTTSAKPAPKAPPTSQEIADAKSKGLVWANLSTHVYHKDSSSLYGTTKRGKFMTEDDAKKAGYRAANESGAGKKKAAASAATQK